MQFDEDLDLGDLTGLHVSPPEEDEWQDEESGPLSKEILPALGLDALERDRYGFHVVGGYNVGENLAEAFGEEETLLIDADRFNPDHFTHRVDVLSKGGQAPIRVVIQNLGEVRPEGVYELEKLFQRENGYPIKSIWLVDDGTEVDRGLRDKVLMRCDQIVDADTLLDAVAFGWGSQNAYNGQPVGGPVDMYGHDRDVIPSDAPLFNKQGVLPEGEESELIEGDNLLLEIAYNDLEKKFIRLGLDPMAQGGEVGNSGASFFKSLRNRGITPDEMLDTSGDVPIKRPGGTPMPMPTKRPGEKFYRASDL